jgi:hypothetical protein
MGTKRQRRAPGAGAAGFAVAGRTHELSDRPQTGGFARVSGEAVPVRFFSSGARRATPCRDPMLGC